jgi:DtxR family Mn-dependent transcriptional regulator
MILQNRHIKSEKLINKLDDFLGNPTEDPHGDPIPNAEGQILKIDKQLLSELTVGKSGICVGVKILLIRVLKYLEQAGNRLGF